jgi:DNA-binding CsgD family transcriptional regulator
MVVKVNPGQERDGGYRKGRIHITRRELETLALFGNGLEIEEVAKKMGRKPQTIKNHLFNVMKKLQAKNRTHALVMAIQYKMLEILPTEYQRELAFGSQSRCKYLWCLHCERTHEYGKYKTVKWKPFVVDHVRYEEEFQECPYEDCNGSVINDAWDWNYIRELNPDYPEVPEHGKVYPLYGENYTEYKRLANEDGSKSRRNEQVEQSEVECSRQEYKYD